MDGPIINLLNPELSISLKTLYNYLMSECKLNDSVELNDDEMDGEDASTEESSGDLSPIEVDALADDGELAQLSIDLKSRLNIAETASLKRFLAEGDLFLHFRSTNINKIRDDKPFWYICCRLPSYNLPGKLLRTIFLRTVKRSMLKAVAQNGL
jgi:hypothetical protein